MVVVVAHSLEVGNLVLGVGTLEEDPEADNHGPPTPVGPPAPYGAPPPMPPGWTQQWDQNSQRWFYIEQATGRTQWDPPSHLPPGRKCPRTSCM